MLRRRGRTVRNGLWLESRYSAGTARPIRRLGHPRTAVAASRKPIRASGMFSCKAAVVVGVTGDLTSRFSAVDLVRAASIAVGGKGGGGRPDMAQAGGPDGDKAKDAVAAVKAILAG